MSSDFGFGIPTLPYVSGRDLVGHVVQAPKSPSRIKTGDIVLTPSTDYRDLRKSAYQSFALASSFNAARIPTNTARHSIAGLGVAFIAAVLALGVCLGTDFGKVEGAVGPNLIKILKQVGENGIPEDVRWECFHGIEEYETPRKGDWVLIWGGKS